jgi:hypothetical protein
VYSNFCEIQLPALRFEKTEEIDIEQRYEGTMLSKEKKRQDKERRTMFYKTHRPQQGSDNPKINLRTNDTEERNNGFQRKMTRRKRRQKQERRTTLTSSQTTARI